MNPISSEVLNEKSKELKSAITRVDAAMDRVQQTMKAYREAHEYTLACLKEAQAALKVF
jgi:prefoldin subunit 5